METPTLFHIECESPQPGAEATIHLFATDEATAIATALAIHRDRWEMHAAACAAPAPYVQPTARAVPIAERRKCTRPLADMGIYAQITSEGGPLDAVAKRDLRQCHKRTPLAKAPRKRDVLAILKRAMAHPSFPGDATSASIEIAVSDPPAGVDEWSFRNHFETMVPGWSILARIGDEYEHVAPDPKTQIALARAAVLCIMAGRWSDIEFDEEIELSNSAIVRAIQRQKMAAKWTALDAAVDRFLAKTDPSALKPLRAKRRTKAEVALLRSKGLMAPPRPKSPEKLFGSVTRTVREGGGRQWGHNVWVGPTQDAESILADAKWVLAALGEPISADDIREPKIHIARSKEMIGYSVTIAGSRAKFAGVPRDRAARALTAIASNDFEAGGWRAGMRLDIECTSRLQNYSHKAEVEVSVTAEAVDRFGRRWNAIRSRETIAAMAAITARTCQPTESSGGPMFFFMKDGADRLLGEGADQTQPEGPHDLTDAAALLKELGYLNLSAAIAGGKSGEAKPAANADWLAPIPLRLIPTADSESFRDMPEGATGLPHGETHPGAFGVRRKNHVHEGVDLYCPEGTPVTAVEDGTVTAIEPFTGPGAKPPSPWWMDTWSVMVEGASGAVLYGEVAPSAELSVGQPVKAGDVIGRVIRVLAKDKGRPMTMLHLELHAHGTTEALEWVSERPPGLRDPTPFLMGASAG